jgi:UDP:flavonoid glycosyltransferase YjiC (YdhE family)
MAERATRPWMEPVERLRRAHGLPERNPLMDGQFSPLLTLAMFSSVLGAPQRDWPAHTAQTGFVFYNGREPMPAALESFLESGPPPVVFTLGSSAVGAAGTFYAESAEAARRLGVRAVLLTGGFPENEIAASSPDVLTVRGAPHQELFPRAAVTVHHGGVGTTGQGLRSGRPSLVVPHAHDQDDNADRLVRLGVARSIGAAAYRADRVALELTRLLRETRYADAASAAARRVRAEGGAEAAADAIEGVLGSRSR